MVGSTYLRIPARTGTGAPYSFEKMVGKEKFTPFPNEKVLRPLRGLHLHPRRGSSRK